MSHFSYPAPTCTEEVSARRAARSEEVLVAAGAQKLVALECERLLDQSLGTDGASETSVVPVLIAVVEVLKTSKQSRVQNERIKTHTDSAQAVRKSLGRSGLWDNATLYTVPQKVTSILLSFRYK